MCLLLACYFGCFCLRSDQQQMSLLMTLGELTACKYQESSWMGCKTHLRNTVNPTASPERPPLWTSFFPVSLVAQMVKNLPSMQEARVRSLGREDPQRRQWHPTPVLLPGESHGWRSLLGYSPWGLKELDTTEKLHFQFHCYYT